jgi:mRNA-degrading endonuclease RelE of RelBE toxin-antitoxin system
MNEIEKLLGKISGKDRILLQNIISDLLSNKNSLNINKLKDSDFYRLRKGKFRIIFHYNSKKEIIIDSIRIRRENTYKDF